jgi:tRNA A-37 threonylcarbamoyl transferase component Bud32
MKIKYTENWKGLRYTTKTRTWKFYKKTELDTSSLTKEEIELHEKELIEKGSTDIYFRPNVTHLITVVSK